MSIKLLKSDHRIDPSVHGLNIHFVLSFEDNAVRTAHTGYFLPILEIKDYNIMIDGKNFNQLVKNDLRT